MPRKQPPLPPRTVVPLCGRLGNSEIACLVAEPLIAAGDGPELVLTSDEWSELLTARRTAGRPLHFVEVTGG